MSSSRRKHRLRALYYRIIGKDDCAIQADAIASGRPVVIDTFKCGHHPVTVVSCRGRVFTADHGDRVEALRALGGKPCRCAKVVKWLRDPGSASIHFVPRGCSKNYLPGCHAYKLVQLRRSDPFERDVDESNLIGRPYTRMLARTFFRCWSMTNYRRPLGARSKAEVTVSVGRTNYEERRSLTGSYNRHGLAITHVITLPIRWYNAVVLRGLSVIDGKLVLDIAQDDGDEATVWMLCQRPGLALEVRAARVIQLHDGSWQFQKWLSDAKFNHPVNSPSVKLTNYLWPNTGDDLKFLVYPAYARVYYFGQENKLFWWPKDKVGHRTRS
jgi:hypothetical protein